ncbi:hypothetical protein BDZ89DRAFT_1074730 [Hymenopellis radicata]|nr:hypothetical protein BDZ89DRAFT_1074730 [Hymenopellis radicata]
MAASTLPYETKTRWFAPLHSVDITIRFSATHREDSRANQVHDWITPHMAMEGHRQSALTGFGHPA